MSKKSRADIEVEVEAEIEVDLEIDIEGMAEDRAMAEIARKIWEGTAAPNGLEGMSPTKVAVILEMMVAAQKIYAKSLSINMEDWPQGVKAAAVRMAAMEFECGATGPKTDKEHIADFATTLRKTREHFDLTGEREMHGVYFKGEGTIVVQTGTSPNSANHARVLVGLLNFFRERILKPQLRGEV